MNIQAIKDKIQALYDEQEKIVSSALEEKRDMSEDESRTIEDLKNDIKAFEEMLEEYQAISNSKDEPIDEDEEGAEEPKAKDEELTACVDKFIRDDRTEEEVKASGEHRAFAFPTIDGTKLNVTKDNGIIIPNHLANLILEKLEEHSQAYAEVIKYPAVKGQFTITRDNDEGGYAGRVTEGHAFDDFKKLGFKQVSMWQERYVAGYVLTQHLLHNSKFDLVSFALEKLAKKMARTIEHSIFEGTAKLNEKEKGFRGLVGDTDVVEEKLVDGALNPTADWLNTIVTGLHPAFLAKSKWYMSREMYQKIALLTEDGKVGQSKYLIQNGIVNGKLTRTLFGFEIVITQEVDPNRVYFGDLSSCFGMTIKKNFELRHIFGDTIQAVQGTHLLLLDIYMDGAVINPQAMIKGIIATQ